MSVVHAFHDGYDWDIWLDTEVAERDGLCIGVGQTRAAAIEDAISDLEEALVVLRNESAFDALLDAALAEREDEETPL